MTARCNSEPSPYSKTPLLAPPAPPVLGQMRAKNGAGATGDWRALPFGLAQPHARPSLLIWID